LYNVADLMLLALGVSRSLPKYASDLPG
jgi:hypothetical protein